MTVASTPSLVQQPALNSRQAQSAIERDFNSATSFSSARETKPTRLQMAQNIKG